MNSRYRRLRVPVRVTVISILLMATALTAGVALGLQYLFATGMARDTARAQFQANAAEIGRLLADAEADATQTVRLLAAQLRHLTASGAADDDIPSLLIALLKSEPLVSGLTAAFDSGERVTVVRLDSASVLRDTLKARPDEAWFVRRHDVRGARDAYLDDAGETRRTTAPAAAPPSSLLPWRNHASEAVVTATPPHLLTDLMISGRAYALRLPDSATVIAALVAGATLSDSLVEQMTGDGDVFLYQPTGELVASNHRRRTPTMPTPLPRVSWTPEEQALIRAHPRLTVTNELDWPPVDFAAEGEPAGYSVDILHVLSAVTGIELRFANGHSWSRLVELFRQGDIDVLQPVYRSPATEAYGLFTQPFATLPYSLITRPGQPAIRDIRELAGQRLAIPGGWSITRFVAAQFPAQDIIEVGNARELFTAVLDGRADAGLDNTAVLKYIAAQYFIDDVQYHDNLQFGGLTPPSDLRLVFSENNVALRDLFDKAIAALPPALLQTLDERWLTGTAAVSREGGAVPYAELLRLPRQAGALDKLHAVKLGGEKRFIYLTRVGQDYFAAVVPHRAVLAPAMHRVRLSIAASLGFLLLLIPLAWLLGSPVVDAIRQLEEENDKIRARDFKSVRRRFSRIAEIDRLSRSIYDMAGSIHQHEQAQQDLMDSFIRLIGQAIDDKSPYTAGHCERVPELAMMLAERAEASRAPAFRDFAFGSDEAWREFRVAAWLHDCGKITTPEHVVDKGSKLETIYNRIHEIRTRFEVLLRDAELRYWQRRVENPDDEPALREARDTEQAAIKDDFAFVARMNVGGEFLTDEHKKRLLRIAKRRWTRHLSNRIGLSPLEENRLIGNEPALPVSEPILIDRPEHRIPRHHSTDFDPRLGIRMDIPEWLYDHGEVHNLLIARGTLTPEERYKINEHIIATIRMLDELPLPDELARVPRYASTHHETMKGTGYPRRLNRDELSVPERIMVLADVFEALTAADRPYKKAKPVSVAIDILHKMVEDDHVDADVFELFLSSGVYLDYARRFLPTDQADAVDVHKYLRASKAA